MHPEIVSGNGRMVETDGGTFYVPHVVLENTRRVSPSVLMMYAPENVGQVFHSQELVTGWFARFTAPGYLDATDWEYFETEEELNEWLAAEGEEDDDDEDNDDEGEDTP